MSENARAELTGAGSKQWPWYERTMQHTWHRWAVSITIILRKTVGKIESGRITH